MFVDHWFPFFDVAKTLNEVDRVFGQMGRPVGLRSVPRGTFPPINIYEHDEAVILTAEVPGVQVEDLDITVLGDTLTLKGQRKTEEAVNGNRFYRRERPVGSFARTVTLPESIDPDSVQAEYRHGILHVRMEKAEKAKAKKIAIKA